MEYKQSHPLTTKKDSLDLTNKQNELEQNIADYEDQFINRFKGTFIADVVNLKTEKKLKDIPKKLMERRIMTFPIHITKTIFGVMLILKTMAWCTIRFYSTN